jgi:CBS domain-containing protein
MATRRTAGPWGRRAAAPDVSRWLEPMPVRDWMRPDPVVVRADAPIAVATDLLRTRKIRHLPVVDAGGRLVGIVTDRDLRQVVFDPWIGEVLGENTLTLAALTVREVMTWGVVSVRADTELRAAARLMRERKIGALPVVDGGLVVGILTETDVLAAIDTLLGARLATMRPLAAPPGDAEPYDYGLPIPEAGDASFNQGVVD